MQKYFANIFRQLFACCRPQNCFTSLLSRDGTRATVEGWTTAVWRMVDGDHMRDVSSNTDCWREPVQLHTRVMLTPLLLTRVLLLLLASHCCGLQSNVVSETGHSNHELTLQFSCEDTESWIIG